jgi:integrase
MKHLKPKITRRVYPSGAVGYCVDAGIVNNKRQRRFFPSKTAAEEFAEQLQEARVKNGEMVFSLTSQQQLEAIRCFEKLKTSEASLSDAIDFYLRHNKPKNGKKTVSELVAEFLAARDQANFKPRYLKALRIVFAKFGKNFGTRFIHEISKAEIEEWLNNRTVSKDSAEKLSPLTKRNYLRDLGMLFKHAVEEGYCAESPVKRIKKPKLLDKPVEIFQVHEARMILSAAHQFDPVLVPYLAIGFFAGLRSCELETLDWNEINLASKRIEVTAENAKTSQRRLVAISENLCAWLKPHEKMDGLIVSPGWRERLQKLVKRTELTVWPRNGLRHSFGSYHLAQCEDASKTALQMGHESNKMLFRHYRELVTPEDAFAYWNILPPEGSVMLSQRLLR